MEKLSFITGQQHIGIPTRDIAKTVAFYEQFGFTTQWKEPETSTPTFLELGNLVIETYLEDEVADCNGGIDHIALNVTDVEKARDYVIGELGYSMLEDDITFLPFYDKGVRFFTILGPNHEKVEFNQRL